MNYNRTNNLLGWLSFATALIVYTLTLEPTTSFWDSGEFIASAYKLQVVHQPGAPLYLMVSKVLSLLAGGDTSRVAYWINIGSALASAATILFLFWTITALARKVIAKPVDNISKSELITIMGSGLVGALAYTFSDSFWFSAVEAEVYALSSLCTAIVFWAILKWDQHADEPFADRWLIFIAYVMGLSIGVHLLNLLAIPAIALVYYFRRSKTRTTSGTLLSLLAGIVILAFIQYGIVQYSIKFAAYSDLFFVNTLGLGFGTGVLFFAILVATSLTTGILYSINGKRSYLLVAITTFVALMTIGGGISGMIVAGIILAGLEYLLKIREKRRILNLALISVVFIIFGYGSFAMIVIRAKAAPTLNNNDPDNAFSLLSYVNREQYGDRPLVYGQYFDSKPIDNKPGDIIYRKGKEKYESAGQKYERIYDRNTIMPRMYSDDPQHVATYRDWMGMTDT
ncbi:MAG: glycosyltransferase family 117 protein, partial [Daejeonella sp.]